MQEDQQRRTLSGPGYRKDLEGSHALILIGYSIRRDDFLHNPWRRTHQGSKGSPRK